MTDDDQPTEQLSCLPATPPSPALACSKGRMQDQQQSVKGSPDSDSASASASAQAVSTSSPPANNQNNPIFAKHPTSTSPSTAGAAVSSAASIDPSALLVSAYPSAPPSAPAPITTAASSVSSTSSHPQQQQQQQQQQQLSGNIDRPFYTRNRRERPCDGCRKRKTRCLRQEGAAVCTMCISHDEVCTFVLEPPIRRRPPPTSSATGNNASITTTAKVAQKPPKKAVNSTPSPDSALQQQSQASQIQMLDPPHLHQQSPSLAQSNALSHGQTPHPQFQTLQQTQYQPAAQAMHHSSLEPSLLMQQHRLDEYSGDRLRPDSDERRHDDRLGDLPAAKRLRIDRPNAENEGDPTDEQGSDIMDPISNASSLGMNETAYSELVGPNLLDHEYQFVHRLSIAAGARLQISKSNYLRPVSNDAIFLMTTDQELSEDHKLVDEIESIVEPYGPKLVALYFRIVHPSYPIIHKTYFLSQYKTSPKLISPPLLAAVYSLALNWWAYDHELSHADAQPDSVKLDSISFTAIQRHLHRARLSTVQAGLLLLQRKPVSVYGGFNLGKTQVSAFTAQLVGVAQALGLHLDCSRWHIPSWEIPQRRRVAWALYVQDRWAALCHGRPSYIDDKNWVVPMLDLDDFCAELSAASGVDNGAELLIEISKLTFILSEILQTFFFAEYTKYKHEIRAPQVVFDLAKPLQLMLRQWHAGLSDCLYMKPSNMANKRLCTTGYLHLAYYTVEIALHRAILRALEGCQDNVVVTQFRTAANDRANAAVNFVRSLSAEYLEAFWIHSSRDCIVEIGQFISLLEVTSISDEEAKVYKDYREGFQWHLRVHSRAAWMFEYALLRLEKTVWSIFAAVPPSWSAAQQPRISQQPQLQQQQQQPQQHQQQIQQKQQQQQQQPQQKEPSEPQNQQQKQQQQNVQESNSSPMLSQLNAKTPEQLSLSGMHRTHSQITGLKLEPGLDMGAGNSGSEFWTSPASSVDDGVNGVALPFSSVIAGEETGTNSEGLQAFEEVSGMLFEGQFASRSS